MHPPRQWWLPTLCALIACSDPTTVESLRARYPSRYVAELALPIGKTHYEMVGSGADVVLVHGVSGPLAVWDKNVEALTAAGFRVTRLDLLGRGFSARLADSLYSLDVYQTQLEQLIDALRLGPRVQLVGSSLGGILVSEYALRHPERVRSLVLIGPAGFPITVPWAARLKDIPVLGRLLTAFLAYGTILKQNDHYFVNGRTPEELRPYIRDQLAVGGTTDAILRTMEHNPVQSYVAAYRRLGDAKLPIGLIWGRQDATFPYENAAVLQQAAPQTELVTIEDAGHLPQYERAEVVNPSLVRLLQASLSP